MSGFYWGDAPASVMCQSCAKFFIEKDSTAPYNYRRYWGK